MSDIIFKTDGKETFHMPAPTLETLTTGTKCPETKLEIEMTEKITLELTLNELKMIDKYVELNNDTQQLFEKIKSAYPKQKSIRQVIDRWWMDTFTSKNMWSADTCIDDLADQIQFWILRNKKAVSVEEQTKPMEEVMDRLENKWNSAAENSASYITDEVIDRMVKKYEAQKLYNRLYDELGYEFGACNDIVDLVEDWIVDEQNASGSQNVNTELLVEGFNDCVRKMKEMLR